MKPYQKSRMAVGVLLLLFGIGLLAMLVYPELQQILQIEISWPLIVVGAGAILFVLGLVLATPSLVIPACILAGIGGLLYWQNQTGNWESWAYAWTLIPGFSGVGQVFAGLLDSQQHREIQRGLWQIFVSHGSLPRIWLFSGSPILVGTILAALAGSGGYSSYHSQFF